MQPDKFKYDEDSEFPDYKKWIFGQSKWTTNSTVQRACLFQANLKVVPALELISTSIYFLNTTHFPSYTRVHLSTKEHQLFLWCYQLLRCKIKQLLILTIDHIGACVVASQRTRFLSYAPVRKWGLVGWAARPHSSSTWP